MGWSTGKIVREGGKGKKRDKIVKEEG